MLFRSNQIAKAISQNLSRTPEDIPKETRIGDLTLISTNPNLSESLLTITQDEQGLTLISGHPYFCSEFGTFSATQQCENLGHQIAKGDMNQLGTARGSYCGVSYSLEKSALFLFTDKVCIFPFYYYKDR